MRSSILAAFLKEKIFRIREKNLDSLFLLPGSGSCVVFSSCRPVPPEEKITCSWIMFSSMVIILILISAQASSRLNTTLFRSGKFSSDNLYSASGRYAVSDSASDAVSPYVGSSYSNSLYEGWGASVVRTFRLTDRLSSQIYLGVYHWQGERLNFSGSNKEVSSRGISPYGGGGIKYRLSDKVNMLLAWNHFEIQGERYDQLGLKFQYRF